MQMQPRARVRALKLVGREVKPWYADGSASVHCDFCAHPYVFSAGDIDELFRLMHQAGLVPEARLEKGAIVPAPYLLRTRRIAFR